MAEPLSFDLLEDPEKLAAHQGWRREVYEDLISVRRDLMKPDEFTAKYARQITIFVLDLTGFTENTMRHGELSGFLRILAAQTVCLPVLREKAKFVRAFADDVVALFDEPGPALDAALEIHRRIELFHGAGGGGRDPAHCCIGIGYGLVYEIGPNHAMGDEMNRASKLGEDTARGGETLITEGVYEALRDRTDVVFERQTSDDLLFPYFSVEPGG